jgi:hypothetical protein
LKSGDSDFGGVKIQAAMDDIPTFFFIFIFNAHSLFVLMDLGVICL